MLGTVDTCDEKPTPLSDGSYNPLNLPIDREGHYVPVPEVCARVLRPHQREGVAFMFACLLGLSDYPKEVAEIVDTTKANGCILADDMGLGKTLQSIAVMWTLLQSFDGQNKRCTFIRLWLHMVGVYKVGMHGVIMSLSGREGSGDKWLKGACRHTAVNDGVRSKVLAKLEGFKYDRVSKVLIVSYEAVRMHLKLIKNKLKFDLIIADEAHRLKNSESGISSAIASMDCRKRLLLTGTPLQNDLNEFFILGALANPVIFTDDKSRKNYVNPILAGINPDATDKEITFAKDKLSTLAKITNAFVLRRSNVLLRTVLPDKVVAVSTLPQQLLFTATAVQLLTAT
ncbi:SNF2 family amine-terminal domain protein, partial [Gregarina niphandrodes]